MFKRRDIPPPPVIKRLKASMLSHGRISILLMLLYLSLYNEESEWTPSVPVNTGRRTNAHLMLVHRVRRWPNTKPALFSPCQLRCVIHSQQTRNVDALLG